LIFFLVFFLFTAADLLTAQSSPLNESTIIELAEGWQYRWGDSPIDQQGLPLWTFQDLDSPEWRSCDNPYQLPSRKNNDIIWLRITLPEVTEREAAIFLPRVFFNLEVFLNADKLYAFGKMESDRKNRFSAFVPHKILLPPGFAGKTLLLRIFTEIPAMNGVQGKIMLGSRDALSGHIIKENLGHILIGAFLTIIGFLVLIVCLIRITLRPWAAISFAFFSLFIGLTFFSMNPAVGLLLPAPVLWYYMLFLGFLFFPPAVLAFVDQIFGPGYKKFIRRLWQLHLLIALIALPLEFFDIRSIALLTDQMRYLWTVDCLVILGAGIFNFAKGKFEARIFTIGSGFFSLFAIIDIFGQGRHDVALMPTGTFLFVGFLGYILFYRFTENSRSLKLYAKKLEEKSQSLEEAKRQLEEYSRDLESKVEERTREVREKQAQLVQSSKMASLGSLVAGVAHEINTPVGAINSMHNTLIRVVEKLKKELDVLLQETGTENLKIKTSLQELDTANKVIQSGTDRVIDIIRRLRSFARLDEAELKDADIHEGLDDTLTIIHHEIKHNIDVKKNYGDIPNIHCYPGRLNQVFLNLLINAKQAIKDKGEIAITTYLKDKKVNIEIKDNGKGIPPNDLDRIFDPGFTTKGVGVGTGLGLAICFQIIQEHKGEIKVDSEMGQGTTFTLILPVDLDKTE